MSVSGIAGTVATLLGVAFIWPQVFRVYSRRSVEGVSPSSQVIGLAGTLMWLTYGFAIESTAMVVSNANIELAIIALVVMLVRKRALSLWKPIVAVVVTAGFCTMSAILDPTAVGVAGVIIGTPAIVPQVWRAVRTTHLFGVSVSSYCLLAAMGSGWFIYGLSIGDPIVSYPNLILVPSASFIAWRAWSSHRVRDSVSAT